MYMYMYVCMYVCIYIYIYTYILAILYVRGQDMVCPEPRHGLYDAIDSILMSHLRYSSSVGVDVQQYTLRAWDKQYIHICIHSYMHVCNVCMYVCYVCMYACMYVCMHACMYVGR